MQLGSAECAHMDILNSVRATKAWTLLILSPTWMNSFRTTCVPSLLTKVSTYAIKLSRGANQRRLWPGSDQLEERTSGVSWQQQAVRERIATRR